MHCQFLSKNDAFKSIKAIALSGIMTELKFFTLLLFFTYANLSLALGLSDIDLRSHLGEQLLAKIDITDADSELDSTCFTATDISETPAFKKAIVTLKKKHNVQQLTIATYQIITEPIVTLRVSYLCEPNINREFVLLMDPVPFVATEKTVLPEKKAGGALGETDTGNSIFNDRTRETKSTNKKKVKRKINVGSTVDKKLVEAYTGKQSENATTSPNSINNDKSSPKTTNTHTDKPFLVISGGRSDANENASKPSLSLRLETQIDFARTERQAAPVVTTEDQDEVTVMANRLAHLEKQIISLQTRNTQLLAEAEKAKNAGFKLSEAQFKWLKYLLIGIVVLSFAEWMRRKIVRNRLDKEEATWFNAQDDGHIDEPTLSSINDSYKNDVTSFGESSVNGPNYGQFATTQSTNQSQQNSLNVNEDKEDSESVLDHAEVFIEHDRPRLAIQLLQNHLLDLPTESPAIWLKLLTLLADHGSEAEYITAVNECHQYFNIKFPIFSDKHVEDVSTIEDYPHIVSRLEGVWGSHLAVGFLNDLIYNQQSQPREGLECKVFEELFFLKQIAEILHSKNPSNLLPSSPAKTKSSGNSADRVNSSPEKVTTKSSMFSEAGIIPEHQRAAQLKVTDLDSANIDQKISSTAQFINTFENSPSEKAVAKELATSNTPAPTYAIDMLQEDISVASKNYSSTSVDSLTSSSEMHDKTTSNTEVLMSSMDGSLVADEIDFSVFEDSISADSISEDELDFGSMPEIFMEEVTSENEDIIVGNSQAAPKDKSGSNAKTNVETISDDANAIEFDWDLPGTDFKKRKDS